MTKSDFPTDPNAETIGLPSDDSGKGSVPEPGKFVATNVPSEIGRYKILGVIGDGGMGVVYEAMQEAPRRRVALKVIKFGAASEMALHRFNFEAQTLAKLSHPNIAQIYEAGTWESEQGKVPFFAMEYIPAARGLVSYAEKRNLSFTERLDLFSKICDAVHHAHQKGVIHRDLKPDNILVDSSGEAKIIDFGVARATDADLAVTTMQTTMGQLIGTLQYMSPEQCDADPDGIDTRSDVYALGVILFQLLSGKLPYDLRRQAIHEAVRVIKEDRPDTLSTANMTLKGDIDTITMKALEKDRERRYQSAAELASDIHHFLNSEPIIARPLSISYQLKLFTRKYKRTCAAVLLLAVSIVLGLLGTTWGLVEANRQREIAIAERAIAQDRSDAILDMSKNYITDFYKGIVKLNVALDVRKLVLDKTLYHLTSLQESSGNTPEIQSLIAYVHRRYGDYYWSKKGSHQGDPVQAVEHHTIALQMYDELVNEGHSKYNAPLAYVYWQLSDIHFGQEEFAKSLKKLDKAAVLIKQFLQENPDHETAVRIQDGIEMEHIDVLIEYKKFDELQEELDRQLAVRRERVMGEPNNLKFRRNLANILQRAGTVNFDIEQFAPSIALLEEARNIYIGLIEQEPNNDRAPRDKAWTQFFLGRSYLSDGRITEGFESLESGLMIVKDRCVADPADEDSRKDLVDYLERYIYFCGVHDENDRANEGCKVILLALQPVVEANPNNYALGEVYAKVQELLGQVGTVATAE